MLLRRRRTASPVRRAVDEAGADPDLSNLQNVALAMNDIIMTSGEGGSVYFENNSRCVPRIVFSRHACTRDIDADYGTFSVCYDTVADKGCKGTLVFACFDDFFEYFEKREVSKRFFYDRAVADKPMPVTFDVDGVPCADHNDAMALASKIAEELTDFCVKCSYLPGYTEDSAAILASDFLVFQCPKKNDAGEQCYSLHMHAKDYHICSPAQHREFTKAFCEYLRVEGFDDCLGIDASIYDDGKPLRMPGCCKRTTGPARTLVRVDPGATGNVKKDMQESLLTKLRPVRELELDARFPVRNACKRARTGMAGSDKDVSTPPHMLHRCKELARNFVGTGNIAVRFGNADIVAFNHPQPLDCARCGTVHTSNTNFYLQVSREQQPHEVTLHCYQANAHTEKQPPPVLGVLHNAPHNYTFDEQVIRSIIGSVSEQLERLTELREERDKLQRELTSQEKAMHRASASVIQIAGCQNRVDELSRVEIPAVESEMEPYLEDVKEAQRKCVDIIGRFYVLVMNESSNDGNHVYQLTYFYNPNHTENDRVSGHQRLCGITGFLRGMITTTPFLNFFPQATTREAKEHVFDLWNDSPDRKVYHGTGYYPTGSPHAARNRHRLNLYPGLAFDYDEHFLQAACPGLEWSDIPAAHFPAIWQVLKERTEYGLSDNEDNRVTWFLVYWLHCLLTCPGQPVPVCHVMYGLQGTGKTLLARLTKRMVGARNTKEVTDLPQLFCDFNAFMKDHIFFVVSEIGELEGNGKGKDTKVWGYLKEMVDGNTCEKQVMSKGKDAESAPVHFWGFFTTNYEHCVVMDKNERRLNMIDGTRHTTDPAIYENMIKEIDDDWTVKIIFHWLYEMAPIHQRYEGADYFRLTPLPRTLYRQRAMEYVQAGGNVNEGVQSAALNAIIAPLPKNGNGSEDSEAGYLFDGDPLVTVDDDGEVQSIISEAVLDKYLFQAADSPLNCPSHIRVPSRSLWHAAENHGSHTGGSRGRLFTAVQSILPAQYRDWYTKYGKGKMNIKVGGKAISSTPIPYGDNGALLRALYTELNKE